MEDHRQAAREFVVAAMAARRMTRTQLAERADVDPKTLRTFLSGERWPQPEKREAISLALNLPPDEIDWVAQHGEPRTIFGVHPLDLAADNPVEFDADQPELMTARAVRDSSGALVFHGLSQVGLDLGASRLEVSFWPGPDRQIKTVDLLRVLAGAHRDLVDESTPTASGGEQRADRSEEQEPTRHLGVAAHDEDHSIEDEQGHDDTP